MGLFGGKREDADLASTPATTVFEPQPLEDWDPGDSADVDLPDFGSPDFYSPATKAASKKAAPKKGAAKKSGAKKSGAKKLRYEIRPPEPGMSEAERRTALRAQMADLARAYKGAPIEEMEGMIKETLVAHGQEVPDDWVTTIAEGLRRNGPTPLNYDG